MRGLRPLALWFVVALVAVACGDAADTTTSTEAVEATAETTQPPATTRAPTTTLAPTTTSTEATTTTAAISAEQLAVAAAIGDIAAGEELFNTKLDEVPDSVSCSSCHTFDDEDGPWAPTLAGISAVAGERVDGMSAVDYLRQSIVDPSAFRVSDEFRFPMPYQYPDVLSEDQINNLIAFLLTR